MADLIAYTDLQTYLGAGTGAALSFSASEITVATLACGAASSAIKRATNRNWEIQGSATTRYFTYPYVYGAYIGNFAFYLGLPGVFPFTAFTAQLPAPMLAVDDFFLTGQTIGSITVTDFVTAQTYTPKRAWPFNAAANGMPYTRLVFDPGTALPTNDGQLGVLCKYGWVTTIPETITGAALLQASRYFKRKDAPFGIAGATGQGNDMRLWPQLDPDVAMMVADYRRWDGVAAQ